MYINKYTDKYYKKKFIRLGRRTLVMLLALGISVSAVPAAAESVLVGDNSTEEVTPVVAPPKPDQKANESAARPSQSPLKSTPEINLLKETESTAEAESAPETSRKGWPEEDGRVSGLATVKGNASISKTSEGEEAVQSEAESPAGETPADQGAPLESTAESAAPPSEAAEAVSIAESTAPLSEEPEPTPVEEKSNHAEWYRGWKMHLLDVAEANQRAHKERILNSRLKIELLSDGIDLMDYANIYYICDNGADYVSAMQDEAYYVYQACITKSGEYFLASDTVNEAIADHVISLIDDSCLHSTADFWNHVLLRDAPQRAYRFSKDRPKDANGVMMVPYYNQGRGYYVNGTWLFTEWPEVTFDVNGHTMHEAGCGFFSTAMALSYVLQRIVSPIEFKENGQYVAGQGSALTIGTATAASYGVDAYVTGDINEVLMALRNGQPVLEHVGSQPFTNSGHYILLVGVLPDGTIAVNDPGHMDNSYWYCGVSWPVDVITAAAKAPSTAYTVFG